MLNFLKKVKKKLLELLELFRNGINDDIRGNDYKKEMRKVKMVNGSKFHRHLAANA
jgi:hypothetical protein